MTRSNVFIVAALLSSVLGCRERKCEETNGSAASPSAASSAARRDPDAEADADTELHALCALGAVPTPPEHTSNHDWDVAVIGTKTTRRRFAWVQLTGAVSKMKPEDARIYFQGLDVGRSNANVAYGLCARFGHDADRRVLVTATYRTSGDARKGDYMTYVALGLGTQSPDGLRATVKDVSELDAKVAVLKQARTLIGEQDLVNRRGSVDDWVKALEGTP